jgi:hypothetical protein
MYYVIDIKKRNDYCWFFRDIGAAVFVSKRQPFHLRISKPATFSCAGIRALMPKKEGKALPAEREAGAW